MEFTPITPTKLDGSEHEDLVCMAEELIYKTKSLTNLFSPIVINSLKIMLRITNCYYSNMIESEGTHPINIENAMKKKFDKDTHSSKLQKLALAYINTQTMLENKLDIEKVYSKELLLEIHSHFYGNENMTSFLNIKKPDGTSFKMLPGVLRNMDVVVGEHIAPEHSKISSMLDNMLKLYSFVENKQSIKRIISAMASHHRVVWVHPFADGNGRASRLFLDTILYSILGEGYGLWSISRGMARNIDDYKSYLKMADQQKLDEHDGRGNLSEKNLHKFVSFMLKISLDQVDYMTSCLRLDKLAIRMEKYIEYRRSVSIEKKDIAPKGIEFVMKELLLKGEIKRGEVATITGTSARTANNTIRWMLEDGMVTSESAKGSLKINFNSKMSANLFPDLVPNALSVY